MPFNKVITFWSNYNVVIAAIIGLVRFKVILKSYRPFVYFNCVAILNELVSWYTAKTFRNNAVNSNIYVLIEFVLLLWLFKNWGEHQRKIKFYVFLFVAASIVWTIDSFIYHPITQFSSVYRIFYSFILIFLSIDQLNYIITTERKNVLKNARFIICSAFIIYYSYKAIWETFYMIELSFKESLYVNIMYILIFVNFFLNLVYALATLWIPTKQKFTQPYS